MGLRVFIVGSCVSRDIFNFDTERKFELVDYYARSSLAALPTAPYSNEDALSRIASPFQRRMVSRDFSKELLNDTQLDKSDIILLDLIDERFDLVSISSRRVVTASAELVSSGFLRDASSPYRLITRGTDERRQLWMSGVQLLFKRLESRGLLGRVVVNKVFWASRFEDDEADRAPAPDSLTSEANRELDWMYDVLKRYLDDRQFITFDEVVLRSNSQHRWGASPFHYVDEYYQAALLKLENLELQNILPKLYSRAEVDSITPRKVFRSETRWGREILEWSSLEAFLEASEIKGGVHSVPLGDFCGTDVVYDFFVSAKPGTTLLCHFHGNTPRGEGVDLPIITGLGVTDSINASLFVASDPVLALNPTLGLAWHFGCDGIRLQSVAVRIVTKLQELLLAPHVVAWGGSGGGFAAIRLARDIPNSMVLAWNPQTDIARYAPDFVKRYVEIAFPRIQSDKDIPCDDSQFSSLCTPEFSDSYQGRIVYLQESTDWHVGAHLKPFVSAFSRKDLDAIIDRSGFSGFVDDRLYLHLGHWGQGHVPPSKTVISAILELLSRRDVDFMSIDISAIFNADISPEKAISDSARGAEEKMGVIFDVIERSKASHENSPSWLKEVISVKMDRIADDFLPFDESVDFSGDTVRLPLFTGEVMEVGLDGSVQWNQTFATQANSSIMWLFSLAPLGRSLSTFIKSSNEDSLKIARIALGSFLEYSSQAENQVLLGKIPSADHSAATRVRVLVKFIQVLRARPDVEPAFLGKICESLKYWSDWLSDPKNYKKNNHGLMGSIALLHSAIQFGASSGAAGYLDVATKRIVELGESSFDQEGLCNENSIGYHNFNLHCYRSLLDFCRHYGLSDTLIGFLEGLTQRATRALEFCVWQDGSIPPIGDSPVYRIKVTSKNESKCFFESGFAVVKNEHLYLSILCGAPTEIHKQVDDSSITLRYQDREILVDGGSYLYDRTNPHRRCVESTYGHSGVFLKDFDSLLRSEFLRKFGPISASIERFEEGSDGVRIKASYSVGGGNAKFVRNIFVCWPDEVAIVDFVEIGDASFTTGSVQRFLFGPAFQARIENQSKVVLRSDEFVCSLYQMTDSKGALYRGEESEAVRGWCSYKFKEILPTYGVDFESNSSAARYATIVKLSESSDVSECSPTVLAFARGEDAFFG